jgi:hypothetical protein
MRVGSASMKQGWMAVACDADGLADLLHYYNPGSQV